MAYERGVQTFRECPIEVLIGVNLIFLFQVTSSLNLQVVRQHVPQPLGSVGDDVYLGAQQSSQIADVPLSNTPQTHHQDFHTQAPLYSATHLDNGAGPAKPISLPAYKHMPINSGQLIVTCNPWIVIVKPVLDNDLGFKYLNQPVGIVAVSSH